MQLTRSQTSIRIAIVVLGFVTVASLLCLRSGSSFDDRVWLPQLRYGLFSSNKGLVANSTLGVQQIFVISSENASDPSSWRQKGMLAAAARTGISVEIIPTADLEEWETSQVNAGSEGQALAWAAHSRALRRVIHQQITTALIMEDDVDWDIDIKTQLAPSGMIASAIRHLTGSTTQDNIAQPYGVDFDLLWIGHCGAKKLDEKANITYPDESVIPAGEIYIWDKTPYTAASDGQRMVRQGAELLCSFAYIVTLPGAARILERLQRGGDAFDVELNNGCDDVLDCLSIQPELMHQQKIIGAKGSLIEEANGLESGRVQEERRPVTANIRHSARCNANHAADDIIECLPSAEDKLRYGLR